MRLRALAKTAAAEALVRAPWRSSASRQPLVLGYHRVVDDYAEAARRGIPAMIVSAATLERHLDWVGRRYRFVSLPELSEGFAGGGESRPPAAVTFDDGYRDVYEHAFPLLRRKGIPGAVFVVTDLVGTDRLLIHDRVYLLIARVAAQPPRTRQAIGQRLGRLGLGLPALQPVLEGDSSDTFTAMRGVLGALRADGLEQLVHALREAVGPEAEGRPDLRAMDWDEVRALHRAGFTIGSHTCGHALLTVEGPARVQGELGASRRRLEAELATPVRHFAYPDGRFDPAVVGAVAAAGYTAAYTTCWHRDPARSPLTVPRQLWWERSGLDAFERLSPAILGCQAVGALKLGARCAQDHGRRATA